MTKATLMITAAALTAMVGWAVVTGTMDMVEQQNALTAQQIAQVLDNS